MGRIDKYPLERMRDKEVKLSFHCPLCRGTRIQMSDSEDMSFWKGVRCPKCKALVLLDNLSVTVVKEDGRARKEIPKQTP
ncbi:MAG: hypothetical protein JSV43_02700 [Methanobacteriota archaeon]|nr:MAG: hypothetical protein JSV43_02700 [Euryarchaeota archaeon]